MPALRIVFAGTPAFAAAHLSAILQSQHEIVAVYTQPDRPSGRGKKPTPSPVKQLALDNHLEIHQPFSLRSKDEHKHLAELHADVMVIVAYGLILPQEILEIPRYGCINVHASLLPRWRGAAPIERALLAGDKVSGVTIMQMDEGLDTGDMLLKSEVTIDEQDSRDDLELKLTMAGTVSLIKALDNLTELLKTPEKQDSSLSCYAEKLHKSESLIDWQLPAELIHRQVRVGIGRSPAYTFLEGQRIRILQAEVVESSSEVNPGKISSSDTDSFIVQCQNSSLRVSRVQLSGKAAATVRDILNSKPDFFAVGKQFVATELTD
ncbi:MAG: methionyl-tRNA formyltransferase [Gammaproteobacteria bacterium]|nr:methionyl-tRNA formyltransferase [Gammaproteobacteria bacterium]MDD9897142.1 methionyl-tRNA formyltransferase [Gammaproteobacteria bacterium]MDD9958071.1 methionyl-tRNA formyltransferase [Gammaproteobacteria bacterium]